MKPLLCKDADFLIEEPLGENLLEDLTQISRVWVPKTPILVLGRSQKPNLEIHLNNAQKDNIAIFRRQGGGGCVFLDENSICIALRYARSNNSHDTTPFFIKSSQILQNFFQKEFNLTCQKHRNYDLSIGEQKFLGASLYMPKFYALYLAVILVNKNKVINSMNRYLSYPSKSPEYRHNRSHNDFLTSINEHTKTSPQKLANRLQDYLKEINFKSKI